MDALCQHIMSFWYTTICAARNNTRKDKVFEQLILTDMQKNKDSILIKVFKKYLRNTPRDELSNE